MIKIDLNGLKNNQQVPKVEYLPIKTKPNYVYLVKKIGLGTGQVLIDGIYRYDLSANHMDRLDYGEHIQDPYKYQMYVPTDAQSIDILRNCDYLMYVLVMQSKDEPNMEEFKLYKVDLTNYIQESIFSIRFPRLEFVFERLQILSDQFALVEILNNFGQTYIDYSKEYIIDIQNSRITEVKDPYLKYSLGLIQISPNGRFVICEEYYMPEEDETLILTNMDYEMDDDYEEELQEQGFSQYDNSIKVTALPEFFIENAQGKIDFLELDSIKEDGIIRVIHTSRDYIYYKKSKHQSVLKNSRDFKDKVLFGKEEIYRLDKNTLKVDFFTALEIGVDLLFEQDRAYKVYKEPKSLVIKEVSTGQSLYRWQKDVNEEVIGFYMQRYLHLSDKVTKEEKLIDLSVGIQQKANKIEVFDGIIFYE